MYWSAYWYAQWERHSTLDMHLPDPDPMSPLAPRGQKDTSEDTWETPSNSSPWDIPRDKDPVSPTSRRRKEEDKAGLIHQHFLDPNSSKTALGRCSWENQKSERGLDIRWSRGITVNLSGGNNCIAMIFFLQICSSKYLDIICGWNKMLSGICFKIPGSNNPNDHWWRNG